VDEAARACIVGRWSGYSGLELLHLTITLCVVRSFIEQPAGSNSTEQLLSEVNWHTEIRFLISLGETRTGNVRVPKYYCKNGIYNTKILLNTVRAYLDDWFLYQN